MKYWNYSLFSRFSVVLMLYPIINYDAAIAQTPNNAILTSSFMVPKEVTLRTTTPSEGRANQVWNLRAALNVAALQCQFSPFLRTVNNYNEILKHHSTELNRAQSVMQAHFRRYDGGRGIGNFDKYTTRVYNSFSTLDAQYSFCAAAGTVGREVLTIRGGDLSEVAGRYLSMLRSALLPQTELKLYSIVFPEEVRLAQLIQPEPVRDRSRR